MRNWSLLLKKSLKKTSFLCSDTSFMKLLKENIHLGIFQNFQDMGLSEKMKEYFKKNAFFSKNSCWIYNFKLFCKQYDILQVIRGTNYIWRFQPGLIFRLVEPWWDLILHDKRKQYKERTTVICKNLYAVNWAEFSQRFQQTEIKLSFHVKKLKIIIQTGLEIQFRSVNYALIAKTFEQTKSCWYWCSSWNGCITAVRVNKTFYIYLLHVF